jgi:CubicO group peptidase (beta-lactamase class C family)
VRPMHDPNFILFLDAVLAAWTAFDLRRALVTGRARSWLGGTVTREHQPGPYWRYVYSNWALLAFCAAIFVAMMSWPDFFR